MKTIFILISLLVFAITSYGQISPALKAGIGYSYVLDEDKSISPDYHTINGYPTFSVEKPFPVEIRLKKRLSINPGLAYHYFKEEKVNGDKDEGQDFSLSHQTINGYVKLLYQAKLAGKTEAFVWAGGIGGMHFISKTKGTKITYGLNQETPVVEVDVNENGKDFFEMFYYGVVAGFQPNARKYNFIKPSFEIAYYPGFVSKPDSKLITNNNEEIAQITYNGIGTIQFTVFLGFRIK
jgi:hypothetical protein